MLITSVLLFLGITGTISVPIQTVNSNSFVNSYRLPDDVVKVSQYAITIDVIDSLTITNTNPKPTQFKGTVNIIVEILKPTSNIVLHASDMTFTDIYVGKNNVDVLHNHTIDEDREFLILNLASQVKEIDKVEIIISYTGKLREDMNGFYVSKYTTMDSKTEYVLTTQFQPTHARKAFPCFDEPQFKATFSLKIKKPIRYKAISNMRTKVNQDMTEFFDTIEYIETPIMSTYLLAFIVSKFESNANADYSNYKVWSRPELIEQTQTAADIVYKVVDALNFFTGINYENSWSEGMGMGKMDMAALPDFSAGAMENWGLLTYRETALLVDDAISTNRDLQRVITVIAHEVAHQWFGDYVTLKWWDNTWLNEGFATYFEYMITNKVKNDWEMEEQFVIEELQTVFDVDSLKKTTPLTYEVFTPSQIQSHFGSISYNKGGSVIRMMQHFLGIETFRAGLQNYLRANSHMNTVPENLWEELNEQSIKDDVDLEYNVGKIMATWISQPGYPVVNVSVEKDGVVVFKQKRFFLNPEESKNSRETWFVPLSFTTSKENDFIHTKPKLWLTTYNPSKVVGIDMDEDDWIIVNIKETGYYRVNYNKENWEKISYALANKVSDIDRINRAQLIDDAMNLARASQLNYDTAFNVTDYLKSETDYYPWYSAFRAFRFLLQRYSENDETGKALRVYIQNLMENVLKNKTLKANTNNLNHVDVLNLMNTLEWACNLGHDVCVRDAKELFQSGQDSKNFKSIVACTAIRHGTKDDWTKVWNDYVSATVAAKKVAALNSLGCTKDKTLLSNYLKMSVEDEQNIRSQDANYVFTAVYTSGPEGVTAALDFLTTTDFNKISERYSGLNALEKAVLGLAGRLTTTTEQKKLEAILEKNELKNIKEAAKETVKQNLQWSKLHGDQILKILKQKNSAVSILINNFMLVFCLGFVTKYFFSY